MTNPMTTTDIAERIEKLMELDAQLLRGDTAEEREINLNNAWKVYCAAPAIIRELVVMNQKMREALKFIQFYTVPNPNLSVPPYIANDLMVIEGVAQKALILSAPIAALKVGN